MTTICLAITKKGRFEDLSKEAKWVPLCDTASGWVGITTGHEQQRLASEALAELHVALRQMIAFPTHNGLSCRLRQRSALCVLHFLICFVWYSPSKAVAKTLWI